jgi:hypothetical protein
VGDWHEPGAHTLAIGGTRPAAERSAGACGRGAGRPRPAAALRELPTGDFSFIYETGQREMDEKGVPETSE